MTDNILHITFPSAFSWLKIGIFLIKFHCSYGFIWQKVTIDSRLEMAGRHTIDKPLPEPILSKMFDAIGNTGPQRVNPLCVE